MPVNKAWHEKNKMPANPTMEERIRWHQAHSRHCGCRPIPRKLMDEIKKRKK